MNPSHLTVIVMIWSAPFFKNLLLPIVYLSSLVFELNYPGTMSEVTHKPLVLTLNIIGQTGTAILLTIIITILMSKKVNFKILVDYSALHLKSCGYQFLQFVSS